MDYVVYCNLFFEGKQMGEELIFEEQKDIVVENTPRSVCCMTSFSNLFRTRY